MDTITKALRAAGLSSGSKTRDAFYNFLFSAKHFENDRGRILGFTKPIGSPFKPPSYTAIFNAVVKARDYPGGVERLVNHNAEIESRNTERASNRRLEKVAVLAGGVMLGAIVSGVSATKVAEAAKVGTAAAVAHEASHVTAPEAAAPAPALPVSPLLLGGALIVGAALVWAAVS
jgi:hypothetical protein